MTQIIFDQEKLERFLEMEIVVGNLVLYKEGSEERIKSLESTIIRQQHIIDNMIWGASKVALCTAGFLGSLTWVGYWLMDKTHWNAVKQFFDTLRGE